MKKKILFIVDWPDKVENSHVLQQILDNDHSDRYEWTVWSCKRNVSTSLYYRWYCYTKGALYAIRKRNDYDAIFIWQQMVGYVLFELIRMFPFKLPKVIFFTFIYNSNSIFKDYKKHLVKNAFRFSKGVVWPSIDMANEVKHDFPSFEYKNHHTLMPIFNVIDVAGGVEEKLDDPKFHNGIYTAGKSERDFDIIIRVFRNTDVPVTIVCTDDQVFKEKNISANIRILRFSQVSAEQYYALAKQAFCVLISVTNDKSPCGQLIVSYAMENSIPIIATNCSGVRDYVTHNQDAILFEVGNEQQIRDAYYKLKKDEAFRNQLVANARISVKKMSPGYFIEKLIHIIEDTEVVTPVKPATEKALQTRL